MKRAFRAQTLLSPGKNRRGTPFLLGGLALVLVGTGTQVACFRATGFQRSSLAAVEIPAIGGDRPAGMKAEAAPGDYYLGNDFVELAVDGTPFGAGQAVAGAASGGSIIDAGTIGLDTSYRRVSLPEDMLDRLTPVVNQDPSLELVFDAFAPLTQAGNSSIQMHGYLLDSAHRISGATWDPQGRVQGVQVSHQVSLGTTDRFYVLETTVSNQSGATLGIQSVGDFLYQNGGGLRAVVPADGDATGGPLPAGAWGVEIPGSDFGNPLATSVRAPMVGFVGVEPAAETVDSHESLGLLPLSSDHVLVASDPQHSLSEARPKFPQRIVVGSLPGGNLAPGQSITYRRKLFILGGPSTGALAPSQSMGIFNTMISDRATAAGQDTGVLAYGTAGTATAGGLRQTEVRFERNLGTGSAPSWHLEDVEWREFPDDPSVNSVATILPVGTYRLSIRNRDQSWTQTLFTNGNGAFSQALDVPAPLSLSKYQTDAQGNPNTFFARELMLPERGDIVSPLAPSWANLFVSTKVYYHIFSARAKDYPNGNFQPLRFTFAGQNGTPDLDAQRTRTLAGIYDPISKAKLVTGVTSGAYQFRAGNQAFGSSFLTLSGPLTIPFPAGEYVTYASRGPLGRLDSQPIPVGTTSTASSVHAFIIVPAAMPTGWTAFDMPGPSMASGGGMLDAEKLSSALAEQVGVVGLVENDRFIDAPQTYNDFVAEFNLPNVDPAFRTVIGTDPLAFGARAASLDSDGTVSAWFTPAPRNERNHGARPSAGWNLADFITQSEGSYVVVHRPRGPKGLFTLRGFNPAVPLGTGANAWWKATGPLSLGATEGGFDAIELLRAEGFDGASPDPWFAEFKTLRRDWFALLNQQTPGSFTKGLGLSSGIYSLDTPVGLSRTYLNLRTATPTEADLSSVLAALKSGAAVASTGPLLDVSINGTGPGGMTSGASVNLSINLYAPAWVPVDEVRVVVNGAVVQTLDPSTFGTGGDFRLRSLTVPLNLPAGKDAWIVVEAGVPLTQAGPYRTGTPWWKIQKGMYPIAVTNPIFVDVNGGGYVPPGL